MMEFTKYAKIKDYYCLCYFGYSDEYLLLLKLLAPTIHRHYPGMKIYFGCKDEHAHILEGTPNILKLSELKLRRQDFAHIRELQYNGKTHPIEDLMIEAGIRTYPITDVLQNEYTQKCVIITKGHYPTKPLEKHQIEEYRRSAKEEGFYVEIDTDVTNAGLLIGVESLGLVKAAAEGVRVRLSPTGIGTRLYKSMFPNLTVLHR